MVGRGGGVGCRSNQICDVVMLTEPNKHGKKNKGRNSRGSGSSSHGEEEISETTERNRGVLNDLQLGKEIQGSVGNTENSRQQGPSIKFVERRRRGENPIEGRCFEIVKGNGALSSVVPGWGGKSDSTKREVLDK